MTTAVTNPDVREHLLRLGTLDDAALVLNLTATMRWEEAFAYHPQCCAEITPGSPIGQMLGDTTADPHWRATQPAESGSAWEELEFLRGTLGVTATEDPITELCTLRAGWADAAAEALHRPDTG